MDERQIGGVTLTRGIRVAMRDGCELAATFIAPPTPAVPCP